MSNKNTFSVIVRDANFWNQSTGICAELANCGHAHRTIEAAQHCMDKLTAWHNGSTSARWYHARVEASDDPRRLRML
jgi:hypothetical protein